MSKRVETVVRVDELVDRDGILVLQDDEASAYRRRWEDEAAADHVASAIAQTDGASDGDEFATLTAKTSRLWERFPADLHAGAVLEIGSGYGRIPLYLAHARSFSWDDYYAVDIAEEMLRRFLEYGERYDLASAGRVTAICVSADTLPLEDDSIDLVLSSAVFLHMGKAHVARTLAEVTRVLRPTGSFVFETSFPNARNLATYASRVKPSRLRPPNFMKYWTSDEIATALERSGLSAKCGGFTIEPTGYTLLPKNVGPLSLPLARRINAAIGEPPRRLRDRLATSYSAFSPRLIA